MITFGSPNSQYREIIEGHPDSFFSRQLPNTYHIEDESVGEIVPVMNWRLPHEYYFRASLLLIQTNSFSFE